MTGERKTALLPGVTKVVELGERVSTAVSGRYLERLGATVTRVLPAHEASELAALGPWIGEGANARSAVAEWLRHGKSLLQVDFTSADERAGLETLLGEADVILVAGTTAEWDARGISLERVREVAPKAVIGQITPWGDSGPYSGLRGGEFMAQAAGGLLNLVGQADREPVRLGGYPTQATAGLLALDGVVIGLFRRQSTGEGYQFQTSEFESVAHLEWKIASATQSGRRREQRGDEGGGPVVVRTRDGHFGCFFIPPNWADLKAIIGDPRLDDEKFSTPKLRAAHEKEFREVIQGATLTRAKKELYHQAQERGIPAGHVATMTDLIESPQYRVRDFFQRITIAGVGEGEIPDAPWQVLMSDSFDTEGNFS
ncbi:CoA transferase [Arthrobacter sp. W4I7]|uniref:CoA transferase n=1 Tax=Arthrobacter sp. W4I7 TaxID=3042296 RepID=UPI00277E07BC|nr:CoA transferase [Arthrobacter sp. W4I7]MDQ0691330.1 crotonobetainyl-CoA:carnitine CoA-transferase CaiB-like acyl-CoA transferase [Arthrobacter sp. W4I7]